MQWSSLLLSTGSTHEKVLTWLKHCSVGRKPSTQTFLIRLKQKKTLCDDTFNLARRPDIPKKVFPRQLIMIYMHDTPNATINSDWNIVYWDVEPRFSTNKNSANSHFLKAGFLMAQVCSFPDIAHILSFSWIFLCYGLAQQIDCNVDRKWQLRTPVVYVTENIFRISNYSFLQNL